MTSVISLITLIILCTLLGIDMAKNDADDKIHERELTIRDYGIDKRGQRYVTVWCRVAIFLPLIPTQVKNIRIYNTWLYDFIRANGPSRFIARYVKTQHGVVVRDNYLNFLEYNEYKQNQKTDREKINFFTVSKLQLPRKYKNMSTRELPGGFS